MNLDSQLLEIFDKFQISSELLTKEELIVSESEPYLMFEKEMLILNQKIRINHLKEKKQFLQSIEEQNNRINISIPKFLFFIVLLSILFAISYQYLLKVDTYNKYYESYPMTALKRSSSLETAQQLGFLAYDQKEFKSAIEVLEKFNDSYSIFYTGLSNMELQNFELALKSFNELESHEMLEFPVNYYRGLCLLKLERRKEALEAFEKVSSRYKYYKNLSKTILVEIK